MNKSFSKIIMVLVLGLAIAWPAFAHEGCQASGHSKDGSAMQCPPDCDKPCCAKEKKEGAADCDQECCKGKKNKICPTHGVKDHCGKKHKHEPKKNFGPSPRR